MQTCTRCNQRRKNALFTDGERLFKRCEPCRKAHAAYLAERRKDPAWRRNENKQSREWKVQSGYSKTARAKRLAKAAQQRFHEKNPDKRRKWLAAWRKRNPGARANQAARRRAAKLRATLPGYEAEIKAIYDKAARLRQAGQDVAVDHYVPLQGKNVCGLHVPWNLRLVHKVFNSRKNNKLQED